MKTPLRRKELAALPDYRKANISVGSETPEAIAHVFAVCRRGDESRLLNSLLDVLEPPASIGGKKLSVGEVQAYLLAVNFARGTASSPDEFLKLTSTMSRKASARFFIICAAAMEAVKAERAQEYSPTDGHRMAALQAKLELERNTGTLPTQKQVKARAFQIVQLFIKNRDQDFSPLEPKNKRWSKILTSVNLDYLPKGVRGKGE